MVLCKSHADRKKTAEGFPAVSLNFIVTLRLRSV